jgi:hypothetical protein
MKTQCRPEKDYYSILGVEPTASVDEIHHAYRARVRITHPDRFDKATQTKEWDTANEVMCDLNAAYSVLRDAGNRNNYDRLRTNGYKAERPRADKPQPDPVEPNVTSTCGATSRSFSSGDFKEFQRALVMLGTLAVWLFGVLSLLGAIVKLSEVVFEPGTKRDVFCVAFAIGVGVVSMCLWVLVNDRINKRYRNRSETSR